MPRPWHHTTVRAIGHTRADPTVEPDALLFPPPEPPPEHRVHSTIPLGSSDEAAATSARDRAGLKADRCYGLQRHRALPPGSRGLAASRATEKRPHKPAGVPTMCGNRDDVGRRIARACAATRLLPCCCDQRLPTEAVTGSQRRQLERPPLILATRPAGPMAAAGRRRRAPLLVQEQPRRAAALAAFNHVDAQKMAFPCTKQVFEGVYTAVLFFS